MWSCCGSEPLILGFEVDDTTPQCRDFLPSCAVELLILKYAYSSTGSENFCACDAFLW